jgi:hypothetical protein
MAIRRPNKPAEEFEADELFAISGSDDSGTNNPPAFQSGFPVGMALWSPYQRSTTDKNISSRLTAGSFLRTDASRGEVPNANYRFDYQEGWYTTSDARNISWMWRRQPGFFDVVCYEGNGQSGREIQHNLGVAPEMIWVKCRNQDMGWPVYHKALGNDMSLNLNGNNDAGYNTYWDNKDPTDVSWKTDAHPTTNAAGSNYIAYLFASLPGVTDMGTYRMTHSGEELEVDCGFTNGARFVLIKRSVGNGNWMLFDTLRGIATGGSQKLLLNGATAQTLEPQLEPYAKGFKVKPGGSGVGVAGGTYIYYAIA